MSGGSYNYLYSVTPEDLVTSSTWDDELERMRKQLENYENTGNVIIAVNMMINKITELRNGIADLAKLQSEVSPVLRAVEWHESMDSAKHSVQSEIDNYNKSNS